MEERNGKGQKRKREGGDQGLKDVECQREGLGSRGERCKKKKNHRITDFSTQLCSNEPAFATVFVPCFMTIKTEQQPTHTHAQLTRLCRQFLRHDILRIGMFFFF